MEATMKEYQGHNYLVIHVSNDPYYGRKDVYHILTDNDKWACGIMNIIVGYPGVENKAKHDLHYKENPSMLNALKPYWECKFVEDDLYEKHYDLSDLPFKVDTDSYYEFTYKEPYDD